MTRLLPAIVLVCLALLLGSASAQPSPLRAQFVPQIKQGLPQISSEPVTLDAGDNTYLGATISTNGQCVFVAFVDRDGGNRVLVKQDAGDHLIDVKLPPGSAAIVPAYEAPGDKQAMGVPLAWRRGDGAAILSLYYTTRDAGDPSGSFKLKRLDIAEPQCQ